MPRLDAGQRAREFPRRRHPRNLRRLNVEAQLQALSNQVLTATSLATQPDQSTYVELLPALPEATAFDFGRFIVVQLPGETLTRSYVGTLSPEDVVFWQLMAAGIIPDDGGATSDGYTFTGHILTAQGLGWKFVHMNASFIRAATNVGDTGFEQHIISTGAETGFLGVAGALSGVFPKTGSSNFYLPSPVNNRIQLRSTTTLVATTPTSKAYYGIWHDVANSKAYSTSITQNEAYRLNDSTLAIEATISASISAPEGIAVDSVGNVYVSNTGNHTIRKYNSALTFQAALGSAGSGDGQFSSPRQIAIDGSDNLYIADSGNHRIQVLNASGAFVAKFGSSGSGPGQFSSPSGVFVFGDTIAVADTGNNRVSLWLKTA
jgi:hypothetical protein